LKRCEWEETVTDDENVYTVMCMITNVVWKEAVEFK
jgi:hypothetical protein